MTAAPPRSRGGPPAAPVFVGTQYAIDVVEGRVTAGRWVRLACQRHLDDLERGAERGLWFDEEEAQRAVGFYDFLKHSKGEWAGRPLRLRPWQAFIKGCIFGWMREYGQCATCEAWSVVDPASRKIICGNPDCEPLPREPSATEYLRRFRTAYEEIARKNGKSTMAAGDGLKLAFFDGEAGAEVYAAATKRDQAKIVWGEASRMVKASPALNKRISVLTSNMHVLTRNQKFEPLGADNDSTDGLNIHGAIVDELHAHKTRSMVDVLETATGARRQPLIEYITTAGYDRHSVCWEKHEYGIRVLEGTVQDDTFFVYIASIDEGDDWTDPAVWAKANPNLGISVKVDDLTMKCERAKQVPGLQNSFRRLHMNVWTEQADRWLDMDVWDENAGAMSVADLRAHLRGRLCYGGLDLSSKVDLSSFSLFFPDAGFGEVAVEIREDENAGENPLPASGHPLPEGEGIEEESRVRKTMRPVGAVLSFSWIPEENMRLRSERDRVPYQQWHEAGVIQATEGNVIDYDFIRSMVNELGTEFEIAEIGYDPFNATQMALQLSDDGFTMVEVRQGFMTLSEPAKELEALSLSRALRHGGDPVLRWAVGNVAVEQDPAGNIKPSKKKSTERIDPVASLVNAIARAIRHENDGSVYDQDGRGFLTL